MNFDHNPPGEKTSIPALAVRLGAITVCRLVLNTARRFAYTFAPALSRGMGLPLTSVTSLIAVNQATGFLTIFFGPLADRYGYRLMMLIGLGCLIVGMFAAGLLPYYALLAAALFLAGMGKNIFDPALQAYVGRRVPFQRRGLVMGIIEISWAGSTLIGIPLIGLLIDRYGWRSPFFALGAFGLLGVIALRLWLPKDDPPGHESGSRIDFLNKWLLILKQRHALGAVLYIFFMSAANDNLFVVYGAWLEKSFQLSVVALGLGTSVIGAAELAGEFTTAALADRLGLKKAVLIGLALTSLAYLLPALMGRSLAMALAGLFVLFLFFEFTIVSSLSLSTELAPQARATMMSVFLASAGLGRVVGALMGGPIWVWGGMTATGIVSAALSLTGLAALAWGLWGWNTE